MTPYEFLAPLKRPRDLVLAALYFREKFENHDCGTVDEIRQVLREARVPNARKLNVADILRRAGRHAHITHNFAGRYNWQLTTEGLDYVENTLGLSTKPTELVHDAGTLEGLIASLDNDDVKAYLQEALVCLKAGALRATIVFVWSAAASSIRERMYTHGPPAVTTAIRKHDPKAREIRKEGDFAYIKDSTLLLGALELGILDKGEKDTLSEGLNLRNRCGHPGKYRPREKKVSAFIEDVVSILYS